MSLCVALAGGKKLFLAATYFSLSWNHSVEKTEWREDWKILDNGLKLTSAAIKGSGAGMDPADGAKLVDGWWVWQPQLQPVPVLTLAASGATMSPCKLCYRENENEDQEQCLVLGEAPSEPVSLSSCP